MSTLLANYIHGEWVQGGDLGVALYNPVTAAELVRVSSTGLDLSRAFEFARTFGKAALRELTYAARGEALSACVAVLKRNREKYLETSLVNSGTIQADSCIDIDGAIFTLGYFAKLAVSLGAVRQLRDGGPIDLAKDGAFRAQHLYCPIDGVALLINAFNFPAWGLWEKAAPALLSGVPVIVKPATSTCWVAQQMVQDIVESKVLPAGALSIICGRSDGLMDQLRAFDVFSFTGSCGTAGALRRHRAISEFSVRSNVESDSVNSALLDPQAGENSPSFTNLVREVVREMTSKSGQKCTAIRRVFVQSRHAAALCSALEAALRTKKVGNPRNSSVDMGSLVSRVQRNHVESGIDRLKRVAKTVFDGSTVPLIDVDGRDSSVLAPWLLAAEGSPPDELLHTEEVFGPVATVIPYDDLDRALTMIKAGQGSLVISLFTDDSSSVIPIALKLGPHHGRVHVVTPDVAKSHTGHGNVMPMSLHGGPGRAGGGEELGGVRALALYHQRTVIQASRVVVDHLSQLPLISG